TLTGSSVGNALFGRPGNQVNNLGEFSTGDGNFTLTDGRALTVTGPVTAQDIVIQTNSTNQGTTLGDAAMTIAANMSAGGNLLITSHGSLLVTGSVVLAAGKNVVLDGNGPFTQQGGILSIVAPAPLVIDTVDTAGSGAQALLARLLSAPVNGGSDTINTPNGVSAGERSAPPPHKPRPLSAAPSPPPPCSAPARRRPPPRTPQPRPARTPP